MLVAVQVKPSHTPLSKRGSTAAAAATGTGTGTATALDVALTRMQLLLSDPQNDERIMNNILLLCQRKLDTYKKEQSGAKVQHQQYKAQHKALWEHVKSVLLEKEKVEDHMPKVGEDTRFTALQELIRQADHLTQLCDYKVRQLKQKRSTERQQALLDVRTSVDAIVKLCNRDPLRLYVLSILSTFWHRPLDFCSGKAYQHLALLGVPGAGKTHFARHVSMLLSALHVVVDAERDEDGQIVVKEATAADFVAPYLGQTAGKTLGTLNRHLEKVLFVDEAYSLTMGGDKKQGQGQNDEGGSGGGSEYGREAVAEIVNFLSTHPGQLVLVVAGYKEPMNQFLVSNVGLARRIPTRLVLGAVEPQEAIQILGSELQGVVGLPDDTRSLLLGLYVSCQGIYQRFKGSPKERAAFMAMTLFGNGIGSIINFAAQVRMYMNIMHDAEAALGQGHGHHRGVEVALRPQDLVCIFNYIWSMVSPDAPEQQKEWQLIFKVLDEAVPNNPIKCMVQAQRPQSQSQPLIEAQNQNHIQIASTSSRGKKARRHQH